MKKVTYTQKEKEAKEIYSKAQRAHEYFMNVESNAAAYHDYMLVVGQSKEYAEKILNTKEHLKPCNMKKAVQNGQNTMMMLCIVNIIRLTNSYPCARST